MICYYMEASVLICSHLCYSLQAMDSKMLNASSPALSSPVVVCFLIFEVTPLIQADRRNRSYFEVLEFFYFIYFSCYYMPKYVGGKFQLPCFPSLSEFNNSVYTNTTIFVVISYVELL